MKKQKQDDDLVAADQVSQSKNQKKHFRKKSEIDENDEEVKRPSEDNGSDSEEERLRDQRERVELERNIKSRDMASTRKLDKQKPSRRRQEEEAEIPGSNALVKEFRRSSRKEYLNKRVDEGVLVIEDGLNDEAYLFPAVKLTEAEERKLRYKKILYKIVKDRINEDYVDEYRIPDAYDQDGGVNQVKRFSVANQRYRDTNAGEKTKEQEALEEHQIGKARQKYGSKDTKQNSDDYQFVFEDQIEFVKALVMKGVNIDDELDTEELEKSEAKSAFD